MGQSNGVLLKEVAAFQRFHCILIENALHVSMVDVLLQYFAVHKE